MTIQQEIKLKMLLTTAHNDYAKELKARAFYKVNDRSLSEDLVQKTFMKTWNYLARGGRIETMKAFLYHILNNVIIDEYRKHKAASLDAILEKGYEPSVDYLSSITNLMDGKIAVLLVERLPEKYKKVMKMRYIEDLTLEEISKLTGQSKNTIAVQIHRGLETLKTLYKFNEENREAREENRGVSFGMA
ncbi:RNA polymerase sigma factor [Candidatus Nomurabacteria bacterium]|nr:RNA polymerase sigma factor [Candidatus Nomurabacteria bacterium]